jgi:hypothetical protein
MMATMNRPQNMPDWKSNKVKGVVASIALFVAVLAIGYQMWPRQSTVSIPSGSAGSAQTALLSELDPSVGEHLRFEMQEDGKTLLVTGHVRSAGELQKLKERVNATPDPSVYKLSVDVR